MIKAENRSNETLKVSLPKYLMNMYGKANIDWKEQARKLLKVELVKNSLTHDDLVMLLRKVGTRETRSGIGNKISRGTFSAAFLLQCLYAIRKEYYKYDVYEKEFFVKETSLRFDFRKNTSIFFDLKSGVSYIDISSDRQTAVKNNKVVSVFSGAGGLDIGLGYAEFETVVCVEIDEDCRETLKYNKPEWGVFEKNSDGRKPGDIRYVQVDELLKFTGMHKSEAGLVVGGAPCQPFSNIGKKYGRNDPENGDLFLEFVRIVRGLMPAAFLFENVAGITQNRHADVIEYMKHHLQGLGYGISCGILNAANYGVAQRRERFFLLGIKGIENPAFPLPTHFKSLRDWKEFTGRLDNFPKYIPDRWRTLGEVLEKIPDNAVKREDYAVMNISDFVVERMKLIKSGENFKVLPMELRPECWRNGKHQGQDTFGRLKLDEPAVTIRTAAYNPAKGKYIHPVENRGLNTIEMAAIQSFPYEWVFRCKGRKTTTLVSAGKQIGNAVPPLLSKALGLAIKAQLPG